MTYPKYGAIFKRIREQKLLSLSSFNQAGISKPALSKFERGLSMMSFESVVRGLHEMGVSLEEFEHFLNDYTLGEKEALLQTIEEAIWTSDYTKLVELQRHAGNMGYSFLSLGTKALYTILTEEEKEEITDFLYRLDIWGYAELSLFCFTMDQLNPKDILHLLNRFLEKGHILFNSDKHRNLFVKICCKAVTVLSSKAYKEAAGNILKQLDKHDLIHTMDQQNLKNMTEGLWIYYFIDKKKGEQIIRQSLNILQSVSKPHISHYYQQRYKTLLSQEYQTNTVVLRP